MEIESKTINLSKNPELFQAFYAIISFDGDEYRADISCKLYDENLARKLQKNEVGTFDIKWDDDQAKVAFQRYSPDHTKCWTVLTVTADDAKALKDKVDKISQATNKLVAEKAIELDREIIEFNAIFIEN